MTAAVRFPAPGKLNLFLHVVGRRDDGYHLLQTAFTFIDRGDFLTFVPRDDNLVVRLDGASAIPPDDDLCVRAAKLLQAKTGVRSGVSISVEKHLPLGAGLGGGSSDAATTLIVLNRLWNLDLTREELQTIGLELGADVPVFIFGRSAFAEGVGEKLTPFEVPKAWYVVLTPPVEVATKTIFADPELTRDSIPIKISDFSSVALRNDLEAVTKHRFPEVGHYLQWLSEYSPARMTGSGSAVFAAFSDQAGAEKVLAGLPETMKGFVAEGWNIHPLADL